jgi:hypothetical protein
MSTGSPRVGACSRPEPSSSAAAGIDCTVKNLSDTGAALEVLSPLYVPDRFTLVVPTDQLKRRCHVVWRRERRIGIVFD